MEKLRYRRIGLQNDDSIIIKKFKNIEIHSKDTFDDLKTILLIDTETTGLNPEKNKIIELGYIKLLVNPRTGKIVEILKEFSGLEDPEEELSEHIVRITGLTNKSLKNQKINWEEVENDMLGVDICIAHKSNFDRPFVEEKIKGLRTVSWSCSLEGINWDNWGFPKKNQEALCEYHGFYFVGHRALNDVKALAELLQTSTPDEDGTYFQEIIKSINKEEYLIVVMNTTFDAKPVMNSHSFSWDGNNKIWYKYSSNKEENDTINNDLKSRLSKYKAVYIDSITINSKNKYKSLVTLAKIKKDGNNKILDVEKLQKEKQYILLAEKTPYETKNLFYDRGYSYKRDQKAWIIYVSEEESEIEKEWLRENVYPNKLFKGRVVNNPDYQK